MIRKEDISSRTNKGLDIIRHLYPDAARIIDSGKLKDAFKVRNERTPSAHLKEYDLWWLVTDFGGDQVPHDPIDLWQMEKGMGFKEACIDINTELMLGLGDIKADVNKPRFEKMLEATPDMKEGEWYYELNEKFTEKELDTMGPTVKQEHVDALHWYSVKWVGKCKDRKITKKYSTDTYPIFMRECTYTVNGEQRRFYKYYEPLNPDKSYRFMYIGGRKKGYINGLEELKVEHFSFNESKRSEWESNPANEGKPFKELKLKQAVICSGERDALCARSLGYAPLWFNSETTGKGKNGEFSEEVYREVMKYVEILYNIPDKDETGISCGRAIALCFLDLRTIWLPDRIERFRDARGRPCKDFRDWVVLQDKPGQAIKELVSQALPAKFWEERTKKKNEETTFSVNSVCLQYFLRLQGFYKLKDKDANKVDFVRIRSNRVEKVTTDDITEFLINWSRGDEKRSPDAYDSAAKQSQEVQSLIIDSPRTSPSAISKLSSVELDFCNYTPTTQLFFFQDNTVRVSADGIEVFDRGSAIELKRYVWEENIIKHPFKHLDAMFEIVREETDDGKAFYDIKVKEARSKVFGYLINSSRLHWRRELEELLEDKEVEERRAYIDAHRFTIDSETLTPKEILDQKQSLINKIFAIGYMLHGFKDPSRAWAPMAMDWKIGDDGECNGRSGKSFLFSQVLPHFMQTVIIPGRNPKTLENPHLFDRVNRHTGMVLFDDCMKGIKMNGFYDIITGNMVVNPKNNQSYNIPFTESPKLAFTTNYVPNDFDASTDARMIYMVFSDYYHHISGDEQNNYERNWSIRDDFGKSLFGVDYTDDEWNADFNFLLQCEQFYLSTLATGDKILPPMDNIILRKKKQEMSGNFEQWAESYFHPLCVEHLDRVIPVKEALDDFRLMSGLKDMTSNSFTRKLRSFARYCKYIEEMNPYDLCTTKPDRGKQNGRILKRMKGAMGESVGSPVDHFYMKTKADVYAQLKREYELQERTLDDAGLMPPGVEESDEAF